MLKLLLVDDERIAREGIRAMLPLESLGIRLTASCQNAFEALDSMADDLPDILLTDIKMPTMDGLALIDRAMKLNPALQCLVLSGYDEFELARASVKLGVREYLLKPVTKEELTEALSRLCQEIRAQRRRMSEAQDDRDARIAELAGKLASLSPLDREIAADQVRALCESTGEEVILREAFTYLITHHESQADKGFDFIRKAYEERRDWAGVIAEGLNRLQLYRRSSRGFVKTMCDYIHDHYTDEGLTLQFLADHVINMQADYIGREFAKTTGKRLSAYLLEVRMERAKLLLTTTEMKVYEVAEAVGLGENPQYFTTLFRKYTGTTPKDFLKNLHQNTEK